MWSIYGRIITCIGRSTLLNSPFETDRNKALLVLVYAENYTTTKKTIIQKGHKNLIDLLRLQQPNNHDLAYFLLKKISGKAYGPNNIDAWDQWLRKMNKTYRLKA